MLVCLKRAFGVFKPNIKTHSNRSGKTKNKIANRRGNNLVNGCSSSIFTRAYSNEDKLLIVTVGCGKTRQQLIGLKALLAIQIAHE